MNVLMIDNFSPGNAYTEELTNRLCNYETISIICKSNANMFSGNVQQLRVLYSGGDKSFTAAKKYLWGLTRLSKEIKSGRYQIVHIQTFKNARMEIGLYKKACKGIKVIHTVHNLLPHEARDSDRKLYTDFYSFCDALIVHNEECKRQLINSFHIENTKIHVIPHGAYSVEPEKITVKKNNKIHFLMFGIIRYYKGVDIFLEAISKIPVSERKNMEFLVAGKQYGNQNSVDYQAMINDLGISDCTKLINERIDDKELPKLFGWTDICVFPYREIYGSGALLMAYAYGKPVIASDVPVFVEETDEGRTGILFRSENASELAKAIQTSAKWTDVETCRIKMNISELVDVKYNWTVSAQKTSDVYRGL